MELTAKEEKVLAEYCRIFDVNPGIISSNRRHAFGILGALYAYPSLKDAVQRRRHLDAVQQETARVWGQNSPFFGKTTSIVAISIFRATYYVQTERSNSSLITSFRYQLVAAIVLEIVGIGGLTGAVKGTFGAGAAKTISENSVRAGLEAAKRRLMLGAGSAVLEAAALRWGAGLGIWAAAFVATLAIAYEVIIRNLEEIRAEITKRHGQGRATDDELEAVQNRSFAQAIQHSLEKDW